jgi:hypothetical protein
MINKDLRKRIEEKKRLLAEINTAILAFDPVLRKKAVDILLADVFGTHLGGNSASGDEPNCSLGFNSANGHEAHTSPLPSSNAKVLGLQDLMGRWSPKTQANQALLSGYHLQLILRYRRITGRQIQNNLKKLGFRLTNVTVATFENMRAAPPRMKKIEDRGRKESYYIVTDAGINFVENNLNGVALACATDHR